MNKMFKGLSFLVLALALFACKKSSTTSEPPPVVVPDTTKPTMTLVDPVADKTFTLGKPLHLQMDLSDNKELKSYKVTVAKSLKGLDTADWAFSQTWTIPAGSKTFAVNHNEITIPLTVTGKATTTGKYDVTVILSDTSGNETSVSVAVVLVN